MDSIHNEIDELETQVGNGLPYPEYVLGAAAAILRRSQSKFRRFPLAGA